MEGSEIGEYTFKEGAKLADEIAVCVEEVNDRLIRFANNEPTISTSSSTVMLDILFKKGRRIIQSSIEAVSKGAVKEHLKTLAARIKLLPEHSYYAELPAGPFKYKKIANIFDPKILDMEKNLNLVEAAIASALNAGARKVCGSLRASLVKNYLFTSKGVRARSESTSAVLELRALGKERIGKLLSASKLSGKIAETSGAATTCGTRLRDLKSEEAGSEAGKLAKLSERQPKKLREGRYDVVFGRNAAAVIFERIGMAFSAFFIDAGRSPFANKLGRKVAPEALNIYDDGTLAGGLHSIPYDAEGYPTQRTELILNGIAKTYLHNSITAKKFNSKLTGNAGWVIPTPHNIYVKPGNWSEDELVEEVREGIYVNNIGYLRYQDELKGDFSAVVRDGFFLIKGGEIVGPLKDMRLNANLLRFLESIAGISKKSVQTLHWWMEFGIPVFTPKILVKDLRFTLPTR